MSEKKNAPDGYVRYCYECGHIGEVSPNCRDCCPDGTHARYVPREIAEQAEIGFGKRLPYALTRGMNDEKIAVSKALIERVLMYGDSLVQAGEGLLAALNNQSAAEEAGLNPDTDAVSDFWTGLRSAAFEYNKQADVLKQAISDAKEAK